MGRRGLVVVLGAAAAVLLVGGLLVFEPWRLWTRSTVDEALPTVAAPSAAGLSAGSSAGSSAGASAAPATTPPPAGPVELSSGAFVDGEHPTTGTARVVELADGSQFLRLEGFSTSDGPDVVVWLTEQPSGGEWGSYDDGRFVDLGELTATDGNQNYAIPAGLDWTGVVSAVIWCDRFDVAFGTAPVAVG